MAPAAAVAAAPAAVEPAHEPLMPRCALDLPRVYEVDPQAAAVAHANLETYCRRVDQLQAVNQVRTCYHEVQSCFI